MALSKERKQEIVEQYEGWLEESRAFVLAEYTGLDMPQIDEIRAKMRESGGEFHIMKNTLAELAFANLGIEVPEEYFIGSTAIGVAYDDPPGLAKVIADAVSDTEVVRIKGGFLGDRHMSAEQIHALAELPPLPVVRGQLLGVLMEPANRLSRLLAEPGRQLAQVFKAYSERGEAAAEPA